MHNLFPRQNESLSEKRLCYKGGGEKPIDATPDPIENNGEQLDGGGEDLRDHVHHVEDPRDIIPTADGLAADAVEQTNEVVVGSIDCDMKIPNADGEVFGVFTSISGSPLAYSMGQLGGSHEGAGDGMGDFDGPDRAHPNAKPVVGKNIKAQAKPEASPRFSEKSEEIQEASLRINALAANLPLLEKFLGEYDLGKSKEGKMFVKPMGIEGAKPIPVDLLLNNPIIAKFFKGSEEAITHGEGGEEVKGSWGDIMIGLGDLLEKSGVTGVVDYIKDYIKNQPKAEPEPGAEGPDAEKKAEEKAKYLKELPNKYKTELETARGESDFDKEKFDAEWVETNKDEFKKNTGVALKVDDKGVPILAPPTAPAVPDSSAEGEQGLSAQAEGMKAFMDVIRAIMEFIMEFFGDKEKEEDSDEEEPTETETDAKKAVDEDLKGKEYGGSLKDLEGLKKTTQGELDTAQGEKATLDGVKEGSIHEAKERLIMLESGKGGKTGKDLEGVEAKIKKLKEVIEDRKDQSEELKKTIGALEAKMEEIDNRIASAKKPPTKLPVGPDRQPVQKEAAKDKALSAAREDLNDAVSKTETFLMRRIKVLKVQGDSEDSEETKAGIVAAERALGEFVYLMKSEVQGVVDGTAIRGEKLATIKKAEADILKIRADLKMPYNTNLPWYAS